MKIKNLYRDGIEDTNFVNARIAPNWAVLKVIAESDLQEKRGGIILTGGQAESKMGVLFFELLNAGDVFSTFWNARKGDLFLLSHLAGDRLGKYVFVESQDILMKYGDDVKEE